MAIEHQILHLCLGQLHKLSQLVSEIDWVIDWTWKKWVLTSWEVLFCVILSTQPLPDTPQWDKAIPLAVLLLLLAFRTTFNSGMLLSNTHIFDSVSLMLIPSTRSLLLISLERSSLLCFMFFTHFTPSIYLPLSFSSPHWFRPTLSFSDTQFLSYAKLSQLGLFSSCRVYAFLSLRKVVSFLRARTFLPD